MKKIVVALCFGIPFFSIAQKQGNVWYFGNNAGLNFNSTPPHPLLNGQTYYSGNNCGVFEAWNEGCSSMCDSSGSLLFYTNGKKIWNKTNQIMQNGDSLMGNQSSTQSSIIIPLPGSSEYFYIFTTDAKENNFQNGLRYIVVDMCLNNGNGGVVPNKKNMKLLDTVCEKLISVKHFNGNDYWVITHKFNSNAFYSYQLTDTGVTNVVVSHTGAIDSNGLGQMKASPNGKHIAYTAPSVVNGFITLLNFNDSTGVVSNEQTLATNSRGYGISFSADNSKLYCSETGIGNIYQYDLNAGNLSAIIASKTYLIQNKPDGWRQMQLAPDEKIYLSKENASYLSIIQFPNNNCSLCNYIDSAIYLGGKSASWGLPNFIDSYKYTNTFYTCNSTNIEEPRKNSSFKAYPNPSTSTLQIILTDNNQTQELKLYNVLGNELSSTKEKEIDVSALPNGVYFLTLKTNINVYTQKIIVQH